MLIRYAARFALKYAARTLLSLVVMRLLARRRLLAGALLFIAPAVAQACSVCFGDPESPMTKGAVAGVMVMVGFVGFVLAGIIGTALFWMTRSRQLARFNSSQAA